MKQFITALLILTCSSFVNAQDTIRKKDGTDIIGMIKEISDESIIYVRIDQPDGPLRKILIRDIAEIRYNDGSKEIFKTIVIETKTETPTEKPSTAKNDWEPGEINTSSKPVIIKRRGPDIKVYPGERFPEENDMDKIFSNGAYLDGLMGFGKVTKLDKFFVPYTGNQYEINTHSAVSFGIRFGNKFYFGTKEKVRFGFNITWVQINMIINGSSNTQTDILFAPVNLGLTWAIKFNADQGLEINPLIGPAFSSVYRGSVGLKYGMDVKWRYQSLAVGLDFFRSNSIFNATDENANILSLSFGLKF